MKITQSPRRLSTKGGTCSFDFARKWLFRECQKVWNGNLDVINFADGRPVSIKGHKAGMMFDGEKFVPLTEKTGSDE